MMKGAVPNVYRPDMTFIMVFYDVMDENVHEASNAFEIQTRKSATSDESKEVYLNDILQHMHTR